MTTNPSSSTSQSTTQTPSAAQALLRGVWSDLLAAEEHAAAQATGPRDEWTFVAAQVFAARCHVELLVTEPLVGQDTTLPDGPRDGRGDGRECVDLLRRAVARLADLALEPQVDGAPTSALTVIAVADALAGASATVEARGAACGT